MLDVAILYLAFRFKAELPKGENAIIIPFLVCEETGRGNLSKKALASFWLFVVFSGTGDNKNTEPPSAGAGSVLGDLLRGLKQFTARFQLLPALSDSGDNKVESLGL